MNDEEPRHGAFYRPLPVFGERPGATEPGEGALDDPSAWQDGEALGAIRGPDDVDLPVADLYHDPGQLCARITAVGDDMAHPSETAARFGENRGRAAAILNLGGADERGEEKPVCVGEDVALPSLDLLTGVEIRNGAAFRGFHALAVDHPGRRLRLARLRFTRRSDEPVADDFKTPRVAPATEVFLHCRERRNVLRQKPPGAPRRREIHQRVQDLPHRLFRRPSPTARRWQLALKQPPFSIRQVACVTRRAPLILRPNDFSPRHVLLRSSHKPQRITSP